MILAVLITFSLTFIAVSIYDHIASVRNNKLSADNVCNLVLEMDRMCHALGYEDLEKYFIAKYDEEEALIIGINISNTISSLKGMKTDNNPKNYALKHARKGEQK